MMRIGEHGLADHLHMLTPLFGFIAAVWILRLVLDSAGVSPGLVHLFSVTGAASLSVLLAVFIIHMKVYGSYPSVVLSSFLLVAWGQVLVILAILFAVITGINNIYTAPEFSAPGDDIYHVRHILGHLTLGIGAGTLFGAATGCLMLWMLRLLVPARPQE